jgi:hypothetical protein
MFMPEMITHGYGFAINAQEAETRSLPACDNRMPWSSRSLSEKKNPRQFPAGGLYLL